MATTTPTRNRPTDQLTVPQVIAELQVSRSTFYGWRAAGKGPKCFRLPNGDLRIRRSDLDRWLESLEDNE
ncbi:helix-turn-helix domain-containing protein [Catellatospora sp. NPDC049609]|uniref:helix-turn-helix transcriptional regulator n=1 Tax=Catellatospora sp. NPDC049609 TaxID=3155505 RepID=UPI00342B047E